VRSARLGGGRGRLDFSVVIDSAVPARPDLESRIHDACAQSR